MSPVRLQRRVGLAQVTCDAAAAGAFLQNNDYQKFSGVQNATHPEFQR